MRAQIKNPYFWKNKKKKKKNPYFTTSNKNLTINKKNTIEIKSTGSSTNLSFVINKIGTVALPL